MTNERKSNYDLLRVISALSVIVLHANANYLELADNSMISANVFQNFINVITRISVPIFVMLSGAFVLNGKKIANKKQFYIYSLKKLIPPYICVYLFWGIYHTVMGIRHGYTSFLIISSWMKSSYGNLWFMPMILGLYLIAPIIYELKSVISKKLYCKLAIILMIWAMVSQATSQYVLPYSIGVVISYLSFFILGDIIYSSRINLKLPLWSAIPIIVALSLVTALFRIKCTQFYTIDPYRAFFSPVVVFLSLLVFISFGEIRLCDNYLIRNFSDITYYIYLIHTIVISFIYRIVDRSSYTAVIKVLIVSVVGTVISITVSVIWKRINDYTVKKVFHDFSSRKHISQ